MPSTLLKPFADAEDKYRALRRDFDEGRIDETQFESALNDLTIQHEERYWAIGATTGAWSVYDGSTWQRSEPPREQTGTTTHENAAAPSTSGQARAPEAPQQRAVTPWHRHLVRRYGIAAAIALAVLAGGTIFALDLDPVGLLYDAGLYSKQAMRVRAQAALAKDFAPGNTHVISDDYRIQRYWGSGCTGHFETDHGSIDVAYVDAVVSADPPNENDAETFSLIPVTASQVPAASKEIGVFYFRSSIDRAETTSDLTYLIKTCSP